MEEVHELLAFRARERPDAPFVRCEYDWLSYAELDRRSDRLAAGLASTGLERGDRVAVILPNCDAYFELIFACAKLGLIQVPLNVFLKGEFLSHQLVDSGARALIADRDGLRAATPLLEQTQIELIIGVGEDADASVRFEALRECSEPRPVVEVAPHDVSCIVYTSGTTGMPKGCMLSHAYLTTIPRAYAIAGWVTPGDRIYTAFPLFHTSGQGIVLTCALHLGGSAVFAPSFRASTFIEDAHAAGATMLFGIGAMGLAILAQPERPHQRDYRFRLASWIPMRPELQAEFERRFGTPVVTEGFGQTECAPATLNPVGGERRPATAGREVAHLEVRVFDEHDRECASGEVGEIVIRPRQPGGMFSGYWRNPAATAEAWRNLWHHTGDYARADEDGYITFVDRKKDSMRRRGENVSSIELEQAILRHPKVTAVAVHAVPSELSEDEIKACIVPPAGDAPTAEELYAFFRDALPYYAIPRYVELRDELPVNALGRVMKHLLRAEPLTPRTWDLNAMNLVVAKSDRR
ncbi:MAG: AMP-binding protein [Solirubrobacteraceae bacterium]